MVSCKKLSGSASRSLCLPLLHHVRLQRKTSPSVVSRVRFSLSQRRSRRFAPSTASETPTVFCLRRKTRWTWSSCLHEQSAQEHIKESCTFVVPISLNLESFDVDFGHDVFPEVVPVDNEQGSCPTSNCMQGVSNAVMKMPSNTLIHTWRTRF